MKSLREQITEIRDAAIQASEGSETDAQWLCPQYGALSRGELRGLALGMGTWLRELKD